MVETKSLPRADMRARTAEAYADRHRAPFSLRCGALLIDYIIVAFIIVLATLIARLLGGGLRVAGGAAETVGWTVAISITVLNFIVLAGLRGQTLGKWATGLRIVRMDGRPLTFLSSLLRHIVGYALSALTLGLGFLLPVFNKHGRALHDIVAGTVVVIDKDRRTATSA